MRLRDSILNTPVVCIGNNKCIFTMQEYAARSLDKVNPYDCNNCQYSLWGLEGLEPGHTEIET